MKNFKEYNPRYILVKGTMWKIYCIPHAQIIDSKAVQPLKIHRLYFT